MSSQSDLDSRLEQLSAEVESWTHSFFERHRPAATRFERMLSYPLGWVDADLEPLDPPAPSGKRLRPALCLLVCEVLSGDYRPALGAAAALELVHNFSLVHDDIQDESPLRRGRQTVWARWETAQAINVGDSLFALAQLALLDVDTIGAENRVEGLRRLNTTCLRLVEGQFLDLDLQASGVASLEAYQTMVTGKTAALLECAAWLGARIGGAEPDRVQLFAEFGRLLGLAFQFQDDVLGVWGNPELTGKPSDTDLRSRKQALPAMLALQASGPDAERFRSLFLSPGDMSGDDAREAARLLENMGIHDKAATMVQDGYAAARQVLQQALSGRQAPILTALIERFEYRSD
jgi:geranylgeranyl diphosphate synthase type I